MSFGCIASVLPLPPGFLWPGGLVAALAVLALRIVLPGLLLAPAEGGWLARTGRVVFAGTVANLLAIVALVSCRCWNPANDWGAWLAIAACAWTWRARRGQLPAALHGWWQPALAVLALATLAVLMPARSEWRIGGWDPGHYQNNAVRISLDGRLDGPDSAMYKSLSPDERKTLAYIHYDGSYRAVANNLPVAEDNSLPLFFFHLTSIAGAALHRLGGDRFLDRSAAFFGLGLLAPLMPLLGALGLRGWRRAVAAAFFFLSPLVWYHQAVPSAEMLYFFLLLGGMADWLESADADPPRLPWMAWMTAFLLAINHLNTVVFVSAMAVYAAVLDAGKSRPRRTLRVAGLFAGLGLGFLWNALFAATTLLKLQDDERAGTVILVLFVLCTAAGLVLSHARFPEWSRTLARLAVRLLAVAGALVLAAVSLASLSGAARDWFYVLYAKLPLAGPALWWLMRQAPFYGVPALVLAAAGVVFLAFWRDPRTTRLALCVLVFGGLFGLILVRPGIAKLFPWGLRRFLVYSVPFVALAQTVPVLWAVDRIRRFRVASVVVLAATVAVAAAEARLAVDAARVGDYPGIVGVLRQIEAALQPGDIVVTDSTNWMAPLMVAGGHNVVNGTPLWNPPDRREPSDHSAGIQPPRDKYLALLLDLPSRTGGRLLWLTSTSKGLDLYPELPATDPEPLVSIDYQATIVVHGERNKYYSTATRTTPVRLYATSAIPPSSSTPQDSAP